MKIAHIRHKAKNVFPIVIQWVSNSVYTLANGSVFRHTTTRSRTIYNEEELWSTKADIEHEDGFIHWLIDWNYIDNLLDAQS